MAELFAAPEKPTVFVDEPIFDFRGDKYCHMFSADIPTLHEFARRIGLKREWFQQPPKASWMHYDISRGKRKLAIRLGARPVDMFACLFYSYAQQGVELPPDKREHIRKSRELRHYMKVAVTGGRDLEKYGMTKDYVFKAMTGFHRQHTITSVVHGCATGVDITVDEWCDENWIDPLRYPISPDDWKKFGKGAGHRRNKEMVDMEFRQAPEHDKIKALLSFPGGNGTLNMTNQCLDAHIPVFKIDMTRRRWILSNPRLL